MMECSVFRGEGKEQGDQEQIARKMLASPQGHIYSAYEIVDLDPNKT